MSHTKRTRTIAFDFDAVISQYHGFAGLEHTGEPIPEVVEAIRRLKELGHIVIVNSTRSTELIKEYCNKYHIPIDYINENPMFPDATGSKPVANVYVDDRALCFSGQSAEMLVEQAVNFRPHWEK